ncbi:isoprenyl transferase [Adhaeribacter aerolatus]|uniref:Isoprenyl transferase n=1 Tax=Adhaeribacter aerolatus TaxID=670289 RepID=A0A512ATK4_9BACT|nr:isoprenyl transferase [Adhaeribacter aerolatus]GEO03013.1 isoprenyl transferase [Adhaeribacter aerolatus]
MNLQEKIDLNNLPKHVAVIMDGNGRWAKKKGGLRIFGHQNAITAVRETVEAAAELGIGYLTLYAFSTENWSRPKLEVNALMQLLVTTIRKETATLTKNNIRLKAIGDMDSLPDACRKELMEAITLTESNTRMTLVLALSYSGRWDITQAIKAIGQDLEAGKLTVTDIREETVSNYLSTRNMPDPELLIRTSGEQRISNFLLWQLAYSELYITDLLWPDFRKQHLYEALLSFQRRERRFGKISEQLTK